MKTLSGKKIYAIVILVLIVVMLAFMTINDDGLIKYNRLKGELELANEKIRNADEHIQKLEAEIDSLNHSLIKIEKVAREKYMMLGENEKVLEIESAK